MSGDTLPGDALRDPVTYPNWMWVVGVLALVLVAAWVGAMLARWWRSERPDAPELLTISQAERRRYLGLVDQIAGRRDAGELDLRGVHLALAGLMRALGTQRTGRDLEVATVEEVAALVPGWPQLAAVLRECERPSFEGGRPPGERTRPGGGGEGVGVDEGGAGAGVDEGGAGAGAGAEGGGRAGTVEGGGADPSDRAFALAREAVES